jgi:CheY-like chemotaxis protein
MHAEATEMRILVVDDEEPIRDIIAAMLTSDGHYVETAANGDDAFRIYCEHYDQKLPFDFFLTGFALTGMHGIDLIDAILKKNPQQRWGLCTARRNILFKPFERDELLAFIKQR